MCAEIRHYIIDVIGEVGGHFASSLGAVELTVALHYLYDTPRDKIVWDVGHQAYVHKILTGRAIVLPTIRRFEGISGFLKRERVGVRCVRRGACLDRDFRGVGDGNRARSPEQITRSWQSSATAG